MQTVGVICEYNPFHLGHARQLAMIRQQLGGDAAVVCLMSGNYVQRGEPAVFDKRVRARAAVDATRNRKIGIIGTAATVRSGSYAAIIRDMMPDVQIFARACPMFVPLVENGYFNDGNPVTKLIIAEYLQELKDAGVDTLILGCTHYPLLKKMIGDFMGDEVHLVDSGKVTGIIPIGCFVEYAPGKEGLVHISKLDTKRVEKVEDVVSIGDEIKIMVLGVDNKGRINLSRKDAIGR